MATKKQLACLYAVSMEKGLEVKYTEWQKMDEQEASKLIDQLKEVQVVKKSEKEMTPPEIGMVFKEVGLHFRHMKWPLSEKKLWDETFEMYAEHLVRCRMKYGGSQ